MGVHPVREALTSGPIKSLLKRKARQVISRPGLTPSDQPDVQQELAMHVLRVAHHFNPARGGVTTFIAKVTDSAAGMIRRRRRRQKRGAGVSVISLERTHVRHRDRKDTPLSQVVGEPDLRRRCGGRATDEQRKAELAVDLANAMEGLTPLQREIALRLASVSEAVAARELGISRRQVRNAVLAIRRHFHRAGLSEF